MAHVGHMEPLRFPILDSPQEDSDRVLVIKLGALGDLVQATGAFAAIRQHHPWASITLLTTRPFVALAQASPWFDDVWEDRRPGPLNLGGWMRLAKRLSGGTFDRVYDLQTSARSRRYYRLMRLGGIGNGRRLEWSGVARGCSHPHKNPRRDAMHTVDRVAEQLRAAGIADIPAPMLDWIDADVSRFNLPGRFAVLVPGGSLHRPEKRWPARHYASLARELAQRGATPVLLGSVSESAVTSEIAASCQQAIDLTGQTSLADIYSIGQRAAGAVGNDTGPMHLIAVSGAPLVVLFCDASDPKLCAPRGDNVTVLHRRSLRGLAVGEVEAALRMR